MECILCAVCHKDRKVTKLEVHRAKYWVASANLHPYTAGHILLFPCRHVADVRHLLRKELVELSALQNLCLDVLDAAYKPAGYNIGFNIGRPAGASIEHLHLHIVPRYPNEAGFLDILSETRSIVESPKQTVEKLKSCFRKISKAKGAHV
ncbi:MAG: HIT domain-containing protein [Candidatus Lindowbacteria bacterium]|nr:HIT domain-containing protein [Candidatus Lindowbacteria bacterium]